MSAKTSWITRTAVLTALLVVLQAATAPLGFTLLTGSLVNMMLILSVMSSGPAAGMAVAALSPLCAKLFGIGPLWSLIPFIAAGNLAIVLIWHAIAGRSGQNMARQLAALMIGAAGKCIVLYFGIVQLAIPLMHLPEKQAVALSATFSLSQLATALGGGLLAMLLLPALRRATREQVI